MSSYGEVLKSSQQTELGRFLAFHFAMQKHLSETARVAPQSQVTSCGLSATMPQDVRYLTSRLEGGEQTGGPPFFRGWTSCACLPDALGSRGEDGEGDCRGGGC